jgi:hypothetical protein
MQVPTYDTRWLKPDLLKSLFGSSLLAPWNCKVYIAV